MILEDNAKVERATFPSLSELGKDLEMRENPVVSTVLLGSVTTRSGHLVVVSL